MPVFRILVVLFVTVPLLELYLLIHVGGLIGIIPTIAICIATAVIGAALMRYQGLQTLTRVQAKLSQGELPALDMLEGAILLLCGLLLLTPGFFTDAIGFLCLVPKLRRIIATAILKHMLNRGTVSGRADRSITIEGEFWEEENRRLRERDR